MYGVLSIDVSITVAVDLMPVLALAKNRELEYPWGSMTHFECIMVDRLGIQAIHPHHATIAACDSELNCHQFFEFPLPSQFPSAGRSPRQYALKDTY